MWTALHQWWLGASCPVPALPVHDARQAAHAPTLAEPELSEATIVRDFTARLLGVSALREEAPTATELSVLKRLDDAARAGSQAPLVPRLPAVLPKLMRLTRRDDVDVRELAELLGREPALLGDVMRIARSPFYLGAQPPTSLDAAVALLGQRGIAQLVCRAVMAPVFDLTQGRFGAAAGTLLWDQAESCAEACAAAQAGTADQFDAYLAGMVANTGLLVALRLLDQQPAGAAPASLVFHDQLAVLSARLSARIARQWRFSDAVALAVESLSQPAGVGSGLAGTLRTADRASKVQVTAR